MTSSNFNRQNQYLLNTNGFRGNNNLNNQEFMFKYEGTKFLWKELMKLNTEFIERSGDISTLEPYVENILYSRMMADDIDYLSNEYITQLITLLQFIGQYLVYTQERLDSENQDLRYTINDLQNKIKDSERSEKLYDELKSQNKEKDFIIKTYQKMIKSGYGLSDGNDKNIVINEENINLRSKKLVQTERKYYPCTICAGKKFKSQKYLDEHIKRRHYDLMESENEEKKESNLENKNYKQIFEGRLNDMKIYFENILRNVQENNGFNFLSRKIDNIQNQIIYQNNNNNNNINGVCAVCGNHLHNIMNNQNNMNILNLNNTNIPKKISEGNKDTSDKNKYINKKYERNEQIDININNKKDDQFERNKKRSISSRIYNDPYKLENKTLSQKEQNSITTTYNINTQSENKDLKQKQKQNNSLGDSTKKEFKENSISIEPNNTNVKDESSKEDKKDNNLHNSLKESKKFINERTPGEVYTPKYSNIKNSNNNNDIDEYQNNKIGKNDYINYSNKTDKKDDEKVMSKNNSNNPVSNPSINPSINDPKEAVDSFYKKFMKRDNKYKGEIDDYQNIDFPKIYKKQENTINMKIIERLGDEENVKPETVDKFIKKCHFYENNNDKKYKDCIYEALGLENIINDYNKLMKSRNKAKNSNFSNQNNNNSQNLSHNQQSISENKNSSKLKDNNSVAKEKDTNLNNNNKINYDQTTMSIIKQNLDQTNNPQTISQINNPQTINQNIMIGYDLKNSVNNL